MLMEKKEPDEDIKNIDKFRDELDDRFENEYDEVKNIFYFDTNPLMKLNVKPNKVLESKQGMLSKSKQLLRPHCPNKFATKLERNKHKASTHSQLKPFVCDQCGKAFWQKGQVKAHGKVHSSEVNKTDSTSFACTVCSKTVSNKYFLMTHIEFVHGDNKPELCSKCGKEISRLGIKNHDNICHLTREERRQLYYIKLEPCVGKECPSLRTQRAGILGWTEEVRPFQQESKYWHGVWMSEGRPSTGWLHDTMVRKRTLYHHAVRRVKRRNEFSRAKNLFRAAMIGDADLITEMKKVRMGGGGPEELPVNVAGANGECKIVEKFREVYSTLYRSASTKDGMDILKVKVDSLIGQNDEKEVLCVTGDVVKAVVIKMKARKSDVSGSFTSDVFLNAADILFSQLAMIFRSWLIHGTVTKSVLACAFLPLLKSSLKDPADTSSNRAIAGSSLILKIFETVILLLWGDMLASDSLQFGYKAASSTTQATWLVHEVVGHYLREGSHPIIGVLDCSSAFDLAKWDKMFEFLLERKVPHIVIRTRIYIYEEQYAWVRWGEARSERFPIMNGTRQGSMASPALWSVYCDPLLAQLRLQGVGCHMAGLWVGAQLYCDDLLLLAPDRRSMEIMLQGAETWAKDFGIIFSTDEDSNKSKSKFIFVIGSEKHRKKPASILLNGQILPWVASTSPVGQITDFSASGSSRNIWFRQSGRNTGSHQLVLFLLLWCLGQLRSLQ